MEPIQLWTIYDHPTDHPEHFVARLFIVDVRGVHANARYVRGKSLDELRQYIQQTCPRLNRIERSAHDEPQIVEVWL